MTKTIIEGIYQTGGSIQADQMAVGRYAKAEKVIKAAGDALQDKKLEEITQRLNELFQALKQNIDQLENSEDMVRATEQVAQELASDKPNKLTLKGIIDGIVEGAKSVTSVVNTATALKAAIFSLL